MTGPDDLPVGQCVCGRALPEEPLSDWACSEPCQSAWMHWHADPDGYPHPREIRAAAEARAATLRRPVSPVSGRSDVLTQVADGTAISVDGQQYVRVGAHWQPAGMWTPLRTELAAVVEYQRWCPRCRERRPLVMVNAAPGNDLEQVQVCGHCAHQWQGRPLVGVVETRGEPWPGLRLRLSDGQRSAALMFTEAEILEAGADMAARIDRCWRRLERELCGGVADADQAGDRERARAARRIMRSWHAAPAADDLPVWM